ncbi:MAG: 23S rRNA (guanosine(2251)-2'-O)-methyltransferase RlmB [Bacilli bacterium]|nr:23S rRNA (guanosine(2251)-2'-O)-methyltransferase RlmB [Bacilli bacterium]
MKKDALYVYGKNAVYESLEAKSAKEVYTLSRLKDDRVIKRALELGIGVNFVDEGRLSSMASSSNHQGIVALIDPPSFCSLDELIKEASKKKDPLVVILDGIEDPHNLGAILRSCDAFGVDGVIMKNRGEVPLNSTVAKVSTGAINWVKVIAVPNLSQAIEKLKASGYWIVASDGGATTSYDEVDYSGPMAVVVGSEGFGISKLVLKNSDFITKIPMFGHVNSLNASVATGIYLAMVCAKRAAKNAK